MKRVKEITLKEWGSYDAEGKPITFIIRELQKIQEEYKDSGFFSIVFDTDYGECYDVPFCDLKIIGKRLETDEEQEKREELEEALIKVKEGREREQLERLKKKYEN